MTNGYLTLTRFKDEYNPEIAVTGRDEEAERAIEAASRLIDHYCGRVFYDAGSATAKTIRTDDPYVAWVPDFHTTTGLVVKTDTTDDGTFDTTWTLDTDFQLEPLDRVNGYPYTRLAAIGSKTFPAGSRRGRLQVTARWGWAAVPKEVELACLYQSTRFLQAASHTAGGAVNFDVEGGGPFPLQSRFLERSAQLLVDPLVRVEILAV